MTMRHQLRINDCKRAMYSQLLTIEHWSLITINSRSSYLISQSLSLFTPLLYDVMTVKVFYVLNKRVLSISALQSV